ncbi:MAG: gamma carbonic anhydrase family protein [Methanomicrobiales archaeon]|nr:gamma carbonic anhydrase family protein [Methanomicrobiales archaeon]
MESGSVVGDRVFIAESATVIGDVALADDVNIWFGAVIRADRDRIEVGAGSNIQDNAVIHTTIGFPVSLGAEVSVGHGAILHGCTIRDRVLVGMGAVVLNGATVGEGSIIGAGAVVTEGKEIPPHSLVLGVPGRVTGETTREQWEHIIQNAQEYIKLAERYRHG